VYIYSYLGYDPDYKKYSVGTILQYLVLEDLFSEDKSRGLIFDFGSGQSEHKRFFSSDKIDCADYLILKNNAVNRLTISMHCINRKVNEVAANLLEAVGVKKTFKQCLRKVMQWQRTLALGKRGGNAESPTR
jgi:CelD/BcsL family acetyltransferase involved in cellulose biosynthesis